MLALQCCSKLFLLFFVLFNLCLSANCQDCELRKVLHEFVVPGCLKKIIPTFGCQGMCTSYVQVSSSKFWELERSCNCCQDMGQKERTVTIECPQRDVKEVQVIIRAPLGCVCRQCTDVSEVQPQEFASYLGNKDQFEESIAFV